MPQLRTIAPITVATFAKEVSTSETTIYKMIKDGILSATENKSRILIHPGSQRKRFYYYRMLTGGSKAGVTPELLAQIDQMEAENAEYRVHTPASLAREMQEKELALTTTQAGMETAHTNNGKSNGKKIGRIPQTTIDDDDPEQAITSMAVSKIRKEAAMAKKAELEVLEKEGKLVLKEDIIDLWKEIGVKVQKAILTIPDRLAPVVAGETNNHKIHKMMTDELKYALRNLSQNLHD